MASFKKTGIVECTGEIGENILKNSDVFVSTTSYSMHNYYYDVPPVEGETYTIQMKATLGEGKTAFGLYNSGSSGGANSPKVIGTTGSPNYLTPNFYDEKTGIWTAELLWQVGTSANTFLRIYQMPNSVTGVTSTIEWVKLEAGNKATPYCKNKTDFTDGISADVTHHNFAEGQDIMSVRDTSIAANEFIEW